MLIDFRPTDKLRGDKPVDLTTSLGPVLDALAEDSVDLSRVRLVDDWIQYRNNFRDIIDIRPILTAHSHESDALLVAFGGHDLRSFVLDATQPRTALSNGNEPQLSDHCQY